MKKSFAKILAIVLVFAGLIAVFPADALAGCNHFTFCCSYEIGIRTCDNCYESYSPVRILHHMFTSDEGVVFCCCGEKGSYTDSPKAPSGNQGSVGKGSVGKGSSSYNSGGYNGGSQYSNYMPQFKTVRFGSFEQDNNLYNGQEPIEWYVIYSDSQKALLISRFALINKQFNANWTNVTWEDSTIRIWLNNDFYYSAFTYNEMNSIRTNGMGYNSWYGRYGEITTADNVFLLSLDEVTRYMVSAANCLVTPTPYAKAKGIQTINGYNWWWLRTMGDSNKVAQFVFENGNTSSIGRDVSSYVGGVRPAIWVDASVIH